MKYFSKTMNSSIMIPQYQTDNENDITKKVDVGFWAAEEALLDLWSTGLLSFHRREREVYAALWESSLTQPPKPSLGCRETFPTLAWAGQQLTPSGPTHSTKPISAHLNVPTRVTSSRYLTRRPNGFLPPLFKKWFCLFPWRCGIARWSPMTNPRVNC